MIAFAIPDQMTAQSGDLVIALRVALNKTGRTGLGGISPLQSGSVLLSNSFQTPFEASYAAAHQTLIPFLLSGLGFVVVIGIVLVVGYVSSSFIVSKLVDLFDNILEKTPGIKIIYTTIKDFFEAFAGNKRKFDRAVLVSIESPDIWRIGFITHEELTEFGLQDYISVYVPQSYAFAGHLYFVKKDRVRLITDISSTDSMKFAISGGVTQIED